MRKTILVKEKNITKKILVTNNEDMKNICSNKPNLCWNCTNADARKCEKIALPFDLKRPIDEYSFIESGIQINNIFGLESFLVYECNNYQDSSPSLPKPKNKRDRKKIESKKI